MVDDGMVVGGDDKGSNPLASKPGFVLVLLGKDHFSSFPAGNTEVGPGKGSIKTGGINDIGIMGIDGMAAAFSAGGAFKFHGRDPVTSVTEIDDTAETAVILHGSVHMKGIRHIIGNIKELADR